MLASQGDSGRATLRRYAERNPQIAEDVAKALAGVKIAIAPPVRDKPKADGDAIDAFAGLAALASRTGHLQGFRVWAIGRGAAKGRGWLSRRDLTKACGGCGVSSEMVRRGLQNGGAAFFCKGTKGRVWLRAPEKAYIALWDGLGLPTLGDVTLPIDAKDWRSLPNLRRALFLAGLSQIGGPMSADGLASLWGVSREKVSKWTYRRKDVRRRTNFEVTVGKRVPEHWRGRNYWQPHPGLFVRRLPNSYEVPGQKVREQRRRLRDMNKTITESLGDSAQKLGGGERRPAFRARVFFSTVPTVRRWARRWGLLPGAVICQVDKRLEKLAREYVHSPTATLWQAAV
jgi:hypothetical protein